MNEELMALMVLQTVRLKGRVSTAAIAAATQLGETAVLGQLQSLSNANAVIEAKGNFRVSLSGRETLARLLAAYNATLNLPGITAAYEDFHRINGEFKGLLTDWQLREGVPNTHTDSGYDAAIVQRLVAIDTRFHPLLAHLVDLAPRLAHYPARSRQALQRVLAGDHTWLARPIADSYHTIWFELHEELIGTLGLSREAEAAAGRAE